MLGGVLGAARRHARTLACFFVLLLLQSGSAAGFDDVRLDQSDALMTHEIDMSPEELAAEEKEVNVGRTRIHDNTNKNQQYKHLDDLDMNALCARVVVVAHKPNPTE